MKNFLKKSSLLNSLYISHFSFQKGFTIIELIVVFAISAIFGTISIASYALYTDMQTFQSASLDVISMLNTAKSRSLSKVKPSQCLNRTLEGYQVTLSLPRNYTLSVMCGGNTYTIENRSLPVNSTFTNDSAAKIMYNVTTGAIDNPSVITIISNEKSKRITINTAGTVSVQ